MNSSIKPFFLVAGLLLILNAGCDKFTRDINLNLPEVPRELVIECYLEAGRPFRVLLTETKGYFDSLNECPMVRGAVVVIEHLGVRDTLTEAPYLGECSLTNPNFLPFWNVERTRFYNYGSNSLCPLDYNNDFRIEVYDATGNRSAYATTRMLPIVPITSFTATFNDKNRAYAFMTAQDDGSTADFYRLLLHKKTLYKPDSLSGGLFNVATDPKFSATVDDARFFNGGQVAWGTGYDFKEHDTLIASIYHLEKKYHDYLETLNDSYNANGNPFAQPPTIVTNIVGGKGIFTFLSYDRDTLIVHR